MTGAPLVVPAYTGGSLGPVVPSAAADGSDPSGTSVPDARPVTGEAANPLADMHLSKGL
ncbi:hypothetical protein GCM10027614_74550 [Micromonospora vulcania]